MTDGFFKMYFFIIIIYIYFLAAPRNMQILVP